MHFVEKKNVCVCVCACVCVCVHSQHCETLVLPSAEVVEPTGHEVHACAPRVGLYVPSAHGAHAPLLPDGADPASHPSGSARARSSRDYSWSLLIRKGRVRISMTLTSLGSGKSSVSNDTAFIIQVCGTPWWKHTALRFDGAAPTICALPKRSKTRSSAHPQVFESQ